MPKQSSKTVEDGEDPLSQSLPSWGINTLKKEVKCVYDSRLFKKEDAKTDDSDYLKSCQYEQEIKKKDKDNSFKDFLNASFNNASTINERKTTLNKVGTLLNGQGGKSIRLIIYSILPAGAQENKRG